MANAPFDMVIFNPLESGVSDDVDRLQSQLRRTLLDVLAATHTGRTSVTNPAATTPPTGFIGEGFRVVAGTGLEVKLRPGLGFIYDPSDTASSLNSAVGLDDLSVYRALVLLSEMTISGIPAGDATNPRIDIIEVKSPRRVTDPTSRLVLDPSTYTESAQLVNKTATWTSDGQQTVNGAGFVNYKTGSAAASPTAPSVSTGYTKIAEVWVPALDASISQNQIVDLRRTLATHGIHVCSCKINLTDAGIPEVADVSAPPGWTIAARVGASNHEFYLYLVAGTIRNLHTSFQVSDTYSINTIYGFTKTVNDFHSPAPVATSAVFNNAAEFNPTHDINDGCWSVRVLVNTLMSVGSSATTTATGTISVDATLIVEV